MMSPKDYLKQYRESMEITAHLHEQAAQLKAGCSSLKDALGHRVPLDGACAAHLDFLAAVQPVLDAEAGRRAAIRAAVSQLPEPYRGVLTVRYIGGVSWTAAARILHYSPRHLQRLHGHALQLLSGIIAE